MKFISELNSRESSIKKGYVKVFLMFIILMITGAILQSLSSLIPDVDYGEPGYEAYQDLVANLITTAVLLQTIGLTFFSLSTFLGGISDHNLSIDVRRGLIFASAIGVIALLIIGSSFQIMFIS